MSKFRWNPETGERVKFEDDETPPETFLPCHPADPDRDSKVGAVAPKVPENPDQDDPVSDLSGGLTKAEIADALKAGGIEFDPAVKKAELCDQLITALKNVLTDRGVAFEENEDAKALLDKATAPVE